MNINQETTQTFYHVSAVDLGSKPILKAKIPECAGKEEPNVPRVCFSTNILGCLLSIDSGIQAHIPSSLFTLLEDKRIKNSKFTEEGYILNPTVYVTNEELYLPPDVSDFRKTKEHWALKDIQVKRIGYLDVKNNLLGERCDYMGVCLTRNKYSKLTPNEYKLAKKIISNTYPIEKYWIFKNS
jgi:hypothetical protein